MVLSDLSIRRPVLATVMSLALVLLGLMSFLRLPVREYPDIDVPVVSVRTVFKGASAEVMEEQVTQALEDSLSGIEGVKILKSSSREEVSQITIEFHLDRDPDAAAADVRDRVARVRGQLPDDIDEPIIGKIDADAQAMLWLAFSSERHSSLEITEFADRHIQDRLQTLPGVASVIIGGERRYAMRLWLDRERMAARGVTVQDVEQALKSRNAEFPGGRIESRWREFTVLSQTDLRSAEEFNDLIIRAPLPASPQGGEVGGGMVRLRDVGRAELGAADERNGVRVNGNAAVGLGVVKQSTANALAVARAVKEALPDIRRSLPAGMTLKVAFDSSLFIEESIKSVYHTLAESLLLVSLVTFAFLRSWRATLIPFVTIPVSLVGAFIFIYALDFSVNTLTLLALVLAIGLVVDDAIVMLENIHRRMEGGLGAMEAAFQGSREIAFAVIAITATLAAVFAPLAFMTGKTGRLFSEFALAVSCAVLVSGFVALTLTPMMCSRLLKGHAANPGAERESPLARGYGRLLHATLRRPWRVAAGFAAVAGLGGWLLTTLPAELSPIEDRSNFLAMVSAPEGATLEYTDGYAREIEKMVAQIPEVATSFMVLAPGRERPNPVNSALAFVTLQPWDERDRKQQAITAELMPKLMGLPGVRAFALNPPSFGQSIRNLPVQFVLQGSSYGELQQAMEQLAAKAATVPGLANPDSDLKLDKPQLNVQVKRDKALDMGIDMDAIGTTLQTLLGGRQVTRFKREGELYDVIVRVQDQERSRPEDIGLIYLRGKEGRLTQLSNLVDIGEGVAPKELNHFNRLRSATLTANIAPGFTLGQSLAALQQAAHDVLPLSISTDLDGQSREFQESSTALYLMFWAALLFVYLMLAAQFESFLDPLIIMLTVPLSIAGAMLSLQWVGGTINVYSQVGMVMLVGLITKNGILIVEFANQLRAKQGLDATAAVVQSAKLRLRPIVMTSLTMILGAVPLALASGAGAEGRQQIGWVIVGGLLLGTLLTMFVIPVVYSVMTARRKPQAALG